MEERQKEKIPHKGRAELVLNTASHGAEKAPEFRENPDLNPSCIPLAGVVS